MSPLSACKELCLIISSLVLQIPEDPSYHVWFPTNFRVLLDRHVEEGSEVLVMGDGHSELGFKLRLIKTWESSSCISWLKMCGCKTPKIKIKIVKGLKES